MPSNYDDHLENSSVATVEPPAPGALSVESTPTDFPPLSDTEMLAWRGFLRAHAHVIRRLEAELEAEQGMPLANYDVLVQLAEADDRSLRMSELASSVLLSRSGLTRLVDRLEREGLVERRACPDDARGTLAVLTDAGMARLEQAWVTHLRGVRQHMISRFDERELAVLGELFSRLGS
jgi:DNA-binding MarR family transcriptional regulator